MKNAYIKAQLYYLSYCGNSYFLKLQTELPEEKPLLQSLAAISTIRNFFFFFFASLYLKVPLSTRIKIVELVKFVKTAFRCETGEKDTMLVFI